VTKLAAEYPDQKWRWCGHDGRCNPTRGLMFKEHEGAYLLGATLLLSGQYEGYPASEKIGAVGALDLPFIRRWLVGFEEASTRSTPHRGARGLGDRFQRSRDVQGAGAGPERAGRLSMCSFWRPATSASSRRPRRRVSPRGWTRPARDRPGPHRGVGREAHGRGRTRPCATYRRHLSGVKAHGLARTGGPGVPSSRRPIRR
jgi:hypothetical protein